MIDLESVYFDLEWNLLFLYALLKERTPEQSISHSELPRMSDHEEFVRGKPYYLWFIIKHDGYKVGAINVTYSNEIGIAIKKEYQRKGYAEQALKKLLKEYKPLPPIKSQRAGRFIANINPDNKASIRLFKKLGFKHIQNTYALE